MKQKKTKGMKYKLTCPNKKCKYMIEIGDDITAHLHKVLKKCPVCKTKYKKSDIPFHKVKLTKKQRLRARKYILKKCDYQKRRFIVIMFMIFIFEKMKIYFNKIKTYFTKEK